jgi:hypothetical protein
MKQVTLKQTTAGISSHEATEVHLSVQSALASVPQTHVPEQPQQVPLPLLPPRRLTHPPLSELSPPHLPRNAVHRTTPRAFLASACALAACFCSLGPKRKSAGPSTPQSSHVELGHVKHLVRERNAFIGTSRTRPVRAV